MSMTGPPPIRSLLASSDDLNSFTTRLKGLHPGDQSIAVSPDGSLILVLNGNARLYAQETGKLIHIYEVERSSRRAWFSQCGNYCGTGGRNSLLHVWNLTNHRDIARVCLDGDQLVRAVTSPRSSVACLVSIDQVIACYCREIDDVLPFNGDHRVHLSMSGDVAFDANGRVVIAEPDGSGAHIFYWSNGESYEVGQITTDFRVSEIRISPCARYLTVWDFRTSVYLFELSSGECLWQSDAAPRALRKISFSSCGSRCLIWSKDAVVDYRDCQTGRELLPAENPSLTEIIAEVAKSNFASVNRYADVRLGREQYIGEYVDKPATAMTTPRIAIPRQLTVRVIDFLTEEDVELETPFGRAREVAWNADGSVLAACGSDSVAVSWRLEDRLPVPRVAVGKTIGELRTFAVSPDGSQVALGTDTAIELLDTKTLEYTSIREGELSHASAIGWSPDGEQLAADVDFGNLEFFNVGQARWVPSNLEFNSNLTSLAFSLDGTRLAVAVSPGEIIVLSRATLEVEASLQAAQFGVETWYEMRFSNSGELLYLATIRGAVWQWAVGKASAPALVYQPLAKKAVNSFCLKDTENRIFIGYDDATAVAIDIGSGRVIDTFRGGLCASALAENRRFILRATENDVDLVDARSAEVLGSVDSPIYRLGCAGDSGVWLGLSFRFQPLIVKVADRYSTERLGHLQQVCLSPSDEKPASSRSGLVAAQYQDRTRQYLMALQSGDRSEPLIRLIEDAIRLATTESIDSETAEQSLHFRDTFGSLVRDLCTLVVLELLNNRRRVNDFGTEFVIRCLRTELPNELDRIIDRTVDLCGLASNWLLNSKRALKVGEMTSSKSEDERLVLRSHCDSIAATLARHGSDPLFPVDLEGGKYSALEDALSSIEMSLLTNESNKPQSPRTALGRASCSASVMEINNLAHGVDLCMIATTTDEIEFRTDSDSTDTILSNVDDETEVAFVDLSPGTSSFHEWFDPRCRRSYRVGLASEPLTVSEHPKIAFWGAYDFGTSGGSSDESNRELRNRNSEVLFKYPSMKSVDSTNRDYGPLPLSHYERWALVDHGKNGSCDLIDFGREIGTRARFLDEDWMDSSILHLSSHGKVHVAERLLVDFCVSSEERITYYDVITSDWSRFELVFLNCCLSAEGDRTTGDEQLSMGWAFLSGGARSVIAHRRKINDAAAAMFALAFYADLFRPGGPNSIPDSFCAGVRAVKSDPRFSDPQVWSSFVLNN